MRRLSASSSVSSELSLRTPVDFHVDFHNDFTTASLGPAIAHKQLQHNGYDLGGYDDQAVYNVYKHGAHEAPKRPWKPSTVPSMSLNSRPPFTMGGFVAPALESSKDYRTGGILSRVFRQASRHR
jgi:hypothetical protein